MVPRLAKVPTRRAPDRPEDPAPVRRGLPAAQRRALAEQKAFRYLETRWRHELKGRPIPKAFRRQMKKNPVFIDLVASVLAGDGIAALDQAATPVVERALDGEVRNRMAEELGGDPRAYLCSECGAEKDTPGREPCPACVKFHQTLYED